MIFKYFIIAVFLVFVLASCKPSKAKRFFDKINESGIRETGYFLNDTTLVDTHIYYYSNGKRKCDEYYIDGKLNGIRRTYYSDGIIQQESNYENGLPNGLCSNFDTKGNIYSKSYFLNGIQVGDAFFYYSNGKVEQYILLDYAEKNVTTIFYNRNGKFSDSIGGEVFVDTLYNNIAGIYADSVSIGILISHPPRTITNLKIDEYDSLGKVLMTDNLDSSQPYINFRKKIDKKLLRMKIILTQYDSLINHTRTELHEILF